MSLDNLDFLEDLGSRMAKARALARPDADVRGSLATEALAAQA